MNDKGVASSTGVGALLQPCSDQFAPFVKKFTEASASDTWRITANYGNIH